MEIKFLKIATVLLGFGLPSLATNPELSTDLSDGEQERIESRLGQFYLNMNPEIMNQRVEKYDVSRGNMSSRKSPLDIHKSTVSSLGLSAGKKLSPNYFSSRERWVQQHKNFEEELATWSSIEPSDRVEDLAETYIPKAEIIRKLDKLPVKGQVLGDYWSGDYWSMNWGLTSYRYSSGKKFKLYKNAVEAYFQPEEWLLHFGSIDLIKLSKEVELWSPSEKYDLFVGDQKFTLTREQKAEGAAFVQVDGKVEDWFGICDGWSPASIFVPVPKKTIKSKGLGGVEITWLPDDIRALASLAWTNGNYSHNLIGRRCDTVNPKTYKNGRISETDCADSNPATFHFALTNLIGVHGIPFIMDATFDAEVWNQPVLAYELKYFNPRYPKQKSANFREVMVPYDQLFKKKDRFQRPLTRGYRRDNRYFDGGVSAIVGVQATVVYLVEYQAEFGLQPHENITERVTYTYDLELHEKEGELIPLGGEWHENTHPDFFWVPKKGEVASEKWDLKMPEVDVDAVPDKELTDVAKQSSREGYPLCSVIEALVRKSSGSFSYRCAR